LVDAYFLNWNLFINAINSALRTLANIVIRCGEFCHHTSIKQSHFGHYLMQMIACLGMTKRKRESCMRRHFLSIVRKNEIVYYFSLFLPAFTHLFTVLSQIITAILIQVAVILFLWYNEEKGGRDMKKQTITTQDAGMPRSCF
jgi:hypothetical protein